MIKNMNIEQDLSQAIPGIWVELEEIYRLPFSQEIRRYVETKVYRKLNTPGLTLDELKKLIDSDCRSIAIWAKYHRNSSASEAKTIQGTTRRIYPKCFEKRLKKVSFIADRTLTTDELTAHTLKPAERIDWELLCCEWNKAFPRRKLAPAGLKTEYYKARSEEGMGEEYFAGAASYLYAMLAPLADQVEDFNKFKQKVKEEFQKHMEDDVVKPIRNYPFKGNEFDETVQEIDDLYDSKMQTLR